MSMTSMGETSYPGFSAALAAVETIVLTLVFVLDLLANAPEVTFGAFLSSLWSALLMASVAVLMMAVSGLYEPETIAQKQSILTRSVPATLVLMGVSFFLLTYDPETVAGDTDTLLLELGRGLWPVVGFLACVITIRPVFVRVAGSRARQTRTLLVGQGGEFERLSELQRNESEGLHIVAEVRTDQRMRTVSAHAPDLFAIAVQNRASVLLIASDDYSALPLSDILQCQASGVTVRNAVELVEDATGRVDLAANSLGRLTIFPSVRPRPAGEAMQRVLDIAFSIVIVIAILPVMLLAAIAVKLQDGGPIFYRQQRTGRFGVPFEILKFRSMGMEAEQQIPQWAAEKDPRVTPVGRILRDFRVDELPQLYNVFRGEMSLVGPRPERPYFVQQLNGMVPFYALRHAVKPGITGWAQVNFHYGASVEDAIIKHSYDLYYVKNRGILLYFLILLRTVRVVLWPGKVMAR